MASSQQMLLGLGGSAGGFTVDAADFDGTNDYLSRTSSFTGLVDSKTGLMSAWINLDTILIDSQSDEQSTVLVGEVVGGGGLGPVALIELKAVKAPVFGGAVGKYRLIYQASDTGANTIFGSNSATDLTFNTWVHVMASFDVNTASLQFYVNNVSDVTGITFPQNINIPYTSATKWMVGGMDNLSSTVAFVPIPGWDGGLAEVFFAPGQTLDLSNSSNRAKFISAGAPVNLGTTGSLPTGTAPKLYLHLSLAETANDLATNRSANGDMTVTGALTTRATHP